MPVDNDKVTATKQAGGRDNKGRFTTGNKPSVGFHTNPERRSNGSWKKEDTARGRLEAMLNMTMAEFQELLRLNETDPNQKLGDVLIGGILNSMMTKDGSGRISVDSDGLIRLYEFIYGRKTESDTTLHGDHARSPIIKGFVISTFPEHFIDVPVK